MSIRKKRGSFGEEFPPVCDCCGVVLRNERGTTDHIGDMFDDPFYEWDSMIDAKKEAGWKSRRMLGEWFDLCPACIESYDSMVKPRNTAANDFRGIGRA